MSQAQQSEAWALAAHALRDVGDAALGEWREAGKTAIHLRRRLTHQEWPGAWGMDLRSTPEGLTRLADVSQCSARLYGVAAMTPADTAALVEAIRQAYRDALVIQAGRDEYQRLAKEKDAETQEAWKKLHRLQTRLMEGT